MSPEELILTGLAVKIDQKWSSFQIQRMLFLFDQEITSKLGGPFFEFEAMAYGPIDKKIYGLIEKLVAQQKLFEIPEGRRMVYVLSVQGYQTGQGILATLDYQIRDYLERVADFLTQHSFSEVVTAFYQKYPVFRAAGVFGNPDASSVSLENQND